MYMKIVSIMIFYINLHIGQITLTLVLGILVYFFVKEGPFKKAKKKQCSVLAGFFCLCKKLENGKKLSE